jgi:hypothetical protein
VPAALRASAQRRSGLAAYFVAPLWRAPLVQSAKGKSLIDKRGNSTLRVQTPHSPRVIVAALEHAHPSILPNGGSLRSHPVRHAPRRAGHEAPRSARAAPKRSTDNRCSRTPGLLLDGVTPAVPTPVVDNHGAGLAASIGPRWGLVASLPFRTPATSEVHHQTIGRSGVLSRSCSVQHVPQKTVIIQTVAEQRPLASSTWTPLPSSWPAVDNLLFGREPG